MVKTGEITRTIPAALVVVGVGARANVEIFGDQVRVQVQPANTMLTVLCLENGLGEEPVQSIEEQRHTCCMSRVG